MDEDKQLAAARAMRRRVLGDAVVDARPPDELEAHVTRMAWGAWAREGALSVRDRSLLVLAMTAALGRMEEFRLHAATQERTGVTDEEVDELLFQVAGYCGAPAAVAARRAVEAVRAERS